MRSVSLFIAPFRGPFKGGATVIVDILGGEAYCSFVTIVEALPLAKSGLIKLLGVSDTRGMRLTPQNLQERTVSGG